MTTHHSEGARNVQQTADQAKAEATELKQKAEDEAKALAGEARHEAQKLANQAQQQAMSTLETRKSDMAHELDTLAQAFQKTGQQLRNQNQNAVANYSDRVAEQVQQISGYLENNEIDQMLTDVENFARRQPELFLGGAFALGLLAGRFFKSSSPPPPMAQGGYWQGESYRQPARSTQRRSYSPTTTGYAGPTSSRVVTSYDTDYDTEEG